MNILLIQPPCVVSSQVTELYIHINSKFSKSNCQALTPFLIFLQCKGVRNLEYESRDNIQRPGSNWRLYLIFNSFCGFFILLIVSFSSKCCFDSLYILDRVIFLFKNHFSALIFVKHFEWIHHMTCWLQQSSVQSCGPQATEIKDFGFVQSLIIRRFPEVY